MQALGEDLAHMPFSQHKFFKFQNGMLRRIESLRPKAEESLELAVDTMMQERVDSFFRVEEGLEEVIKSLAQIEQEIGEIRDLSGAMRLESRLEFVEDRWDDFDSEIRERPRRRRRKISLADMLKAPWAWNSAVRSPRSPPPFVTRLSNFIRIRITATAAPSRSYAACWRPTSSSLSARPVRPILCIYCSGISGNCMLITCVISVISNPRAIISVVTKPLISPFWKFSIMFKR